MNDNLWHKVNIMRNLILENLKKPYHPGLAEINAPVGPQEVVGHTLNSQMLID